MYLERFVLIFVLFYTGQIPGVIGGGRWTTHGESCYYISTSTVGYASQAAIECSKHGGYLVEVETMEEHYQLITDLNKGDEYWVGLEGNGAGDLVWIINRTESVIPYAITGNHNQARYEYEKGIGWNFDDKGGPHNIGYICEKRKTYVTTVSCDMTNEVAVDMDTKQTLQSSNQNIVNHQSSWATDDSIGTCAITSVENNPWWQIDLSQPMFIKNVIVNFGSLPVSSSLDNIFITTFISDPMLDHFNVVFRCGVFETDGQTLSVYFECTPQTVGRYLRIKMEAVGDLSLCDVKINGTHAYTCTNEKTENACSTTKTDRYIFSYESPITSVSISPSPCYNMPVESSIQDQVSSTLIQMSTFSDQEQVQSSFSSNSDTANIYSSPYDTTMLVSMTSVQTFDELIEKLKIDNKATNSYRRSLISAEDDRISSQYIGYVGIILLVVFVVIVIATDLNRFYFLICNTVRQK